MYVKNLLIEISKQNPGKKIGLISHSVLIKAIFSKLEDNCLIKNHKFHLENGNLIGVNLYWNNGEIK